MINCLNAQLSQLEVLNNESLRIYNQLEKNYIGALKEIEMKPKSGWFSSVVKYAFKGKKSNNYTPQMDLDEISQIFGTLNSADIATLYFLRKHCQRQGLLDPIKDPNLCLEYPEVIIKSVQNRLGLINSFVIHSTAGIMRSPSGWLYHVITAAELMRDVDPKNLMEYRVQQAVISAVAPKDFEDFLKKPNILSEEEVKSEVKEEQSQQESTEPNIKELKGTNLKETTELNETKPEETKSKQLEETKSKDSEKLNSIDSSISQIEHLPHSPPVQPVHLVKPKQQEQVAQPVKSEQPVQQDQITQPSLEQSNQHFSSAGFDNSPPLRDSSLSSMLSEPKVTINSDHTTEGTVGLSVHVQL